MRVVVLGAAGQLGRELVRALAEREHAVCAAVRRPPIPGFGCSVEVRIADARNKAEVRTAMSGFDTVVKVIGGARCAAMMSRPPGLWWQWQRR